MMIDSQKLREALKRHGNVGSMSSYELALIDSVLTGIEIAQMDRNFETRLKRTRSRIHNAAKRDRANWDRAFSLGWSAGERGISPDRCPKFKSADRRKAWLDAHQAATQTFKR